MRAGDSGPHTGLGVEARSVFQVDGSITQEREAKAGGEDSENTPCGPSPLPGRLLPDVWGSPLTPLPAAEHL